MTNVAEIAKGLSEAQRRFLERTNLGLTLERYADFRTVVALDRKGLTGRYMRDSDFETLVTLTPIGLAVRSYLESNRP